MLKYQRINRLTSLLIGWLLVSAGGNLFAAGPITNITVLVLTNNFEAGVATNTSGSQIIVNTFGTGNSIPDSGEEVALQLIDGSDVIEYGMTPAGFTTAGGIVNGGNVSLPITLFRAGTAIKIRAISETNAITADSSAFTVLASSAAKLVVVGPGETHLPGTNPASTTGKTGSFTAQEANQPFTARVILTDNQFNTVSGNDTVHFISDPTLIELPADGPLTAGEADFSITITGPNVARTITVQDLSNGSVANGTLVANTAGPPAKKVFPFPNPFNPHQGNITFRFRLDSSSSVNLIVTDRFGQKVWTRSVGAQSGSNDVAWNGRNDNGIVVAAGVYYVILENGSTIESRTAFGVTK